MSEEAAPKQEMELDEATGGENPETSPPADKEAGEEQAPEVQEGEEDTVQPDDGSGYLEEILSEKVTKEDLEAQYPALQSPPPPKPKGPQGNYPVGAMVEIVKPGSKFSDDFLKEEVADKEYSWMQDMGLIKAGSYGEVLGHVRHKTRRITVHVVRVEGLSTNNVVLMHPDGIGAAFWKGQLITICNPGSRYEPSDFPGLFPVEEAKWIPQVEVRRNRTGRIVAIVVHPKDTSKHLHLVRIEPPGPPDDRYCIMQGSGIKDCKHSQLAALKGKGQKRAADEPAGGKQGKGGYGRKGQQSALPVVQAPPGSPDAGETAYGVKYGSIVVPPRNSAAYKLASVSM